MPFGYYRIKQEVERRVGASGLPWTIQRATQFHDLVRTLLRVVSVPPIMLVPAGVSVQPVDAGDVASRPARPGPRRRPPHLRGVPRLQANRLIKYS